MSKMLSVFFLVLCVLVIGVTSFAIFVNPNQFRQQLVTQIEQNTGYQVNISGDLRWHIWPQLSILTKKVTLSDPNNNIPSINAENMRLDLAFLPLILNQLKIKKVLFNRAIIQIPLKRNVSARSPVASSAIMEPTNPITLLKPGIPAIEFTDSMIIWPSSIENEINIRNVNLQLNYQQNNLMHFHLDSRVERNQQELHTDIDGMLDISSNPKEIKAFLSKINYSLQGVSLPKEGITGLASLKLTYQPNKQVVINDLFIRNNNNSIRGNAVIKLKEPLDIKLNINTDALEITNFITRFHNKNQLNEEINIKQPTVIGDKQLSNFNELQRLNFSVNFLANTLTYQSNPITGPLTIHLTGQQGKMVLNSQLQNAADGIINVSGKINKQDSRYHVELTPKVSGLDLHKLMQLIMNSNSQFVSGTLSLSGNLYYQGNSLFNSLLGWHGHLHSNIAQARINELDIGQLINRILAQQLSYNKKEIANTRSTQLTNLTSDMSVLKKGIIRIDRLNGYNDAFVLTGKGNINLVTEEADVMLNVRLLNYMASDPLIKALLSNAVFPIHIYGDLAQLNYHVDLSKFLQKRLSTEHIDKFKKSLINR